MAHPMTARNDQFLIKYIPGNDNQRTITENSKQHKLWCGMLGGWPHIISLLRRGNNNLGCSFSL